MRTRILLSVILLLAGTGSAHAGCPEGFVFNTALNKCETAPSCPTGYALHPEHDVCTAKAHDAACPPGSSYNAEEKSCEVPLVCPAKTAFIADIAKCVLN